MTTTTLDTAREQVLAHLATLEPSAGPYALVEDQTRHLPDGWVFFFDNKRHLETDDVAYAIAGNGPIFVSKEGALTPLGSSSLWEEELAAR
jgi:hypothetical protein